MIIDREQALNHILRGNWTELLNALKDNSTFANLSDDPIFVSLFDEYFAKEILDSSLNEKEGYIAELTAAYTFHVSDRHEFKLNNENLLILVKQLVTITKDISIAYKFPEVDVCKTVIEKHEIQSNKTIKKTEEDHKLSKMFKIKEHTSESGKFETIRIFKSPQELELFKAASVVLSDHIILPNCALTTVLSSSILSTFTSEKRHLFLTTTIDLVIVSSKTYLPIYFIELDSSYHDNSDQQKKDNLKNELITEVGETLLRVRKKTGNESQLEYEELLKINIIPLTIP